PVGPLAPRIHANRLSFSLCCSHTATGSLFTGQPSPAASVIVRMSSRRTDVPLLTYAYHGVAGLVENAKAWSCTGARLPLSWRPLLTPTPGVKSTSQYAPPCKIGRASCRERVERWVVDVFVKRTWRAGGITVIRSG